MTNITVTLDSGTAYTVTVSDNGNSTHHRVTLTEEVYQDLCQGDCNKKKLIEASFRFLLDRESKESILQTFSLELIGRYFPEYPEKIKGYL